MLEEQGKSTQRWSGIVFAKRKLTVVALDKLLAVVPRLAFLKAQAIMGHGGRLAATSLTTKVCSHLPGACRLPFETGLLQCPSMTACLP